MTNPCRHTQLPEPPGDNDKSFSRFGLDPTTDLIETVSVIVAQLHDLVELGLMVEVMQEDEARLRVLSNLLCVQLDYLEQAQTLLDQWEPPQHGTSTCHVADAQQTDDPVTRPDTTTVRVTGLCASWPTPREFWCVGSGMPHRCDACD
jgi:hypothetical protein